MRFGLHGVVSCHALVCKGSTLIGWHALVEKGSVLMAGQSSSVIGWHALGSTLMAGEVVAGCTVVAVIGQGSVVGVGSITGIRGVVVGVGHKRKVRNAEWVVVLVGWVAGLQGGVMSIRGSAYWQGIGVSHLRRVAIGRVLVVTRWSVGLIHCILAVKHCIITSYTRHMTSFPSFLELAQKIADELADPQFYKAGAQIGPGIRDLTHLISLVQEKNF